MLARLPILSISSPCNLASPLHSTVHYLYYCRSADSSHSNRRGQPPDLEPNERRGRVRIGWLTALQALTDYDGTLADHIVIHAQRLPRTAVGLLAGTALGVAGAQMQGLTRNPLAGPGILGINAGAALFVAVGIYQFGMDSIATYAWMGVAGAGLTALVVYAVGEGMGGARSPIRLVLAGAAMTALLSSMTTAILILDVATLDEFRFWVVGAIAGRDAEIAKQIAPLIVFGLFLGAITPRSLNAIAMGEETARSLGVNLGRDRALVMASVVCLAGGATAAAGPIGFVGLAVPHMARAVVGPDYRWAALWFSPANCRSASSPPSSAHPSSSRWLARDGWAICDRDTSPVHLSPNDRNCGDTPRASPSLLDAADGHPGADPRGDRPSGAFARYRLGVSPRPGPGAVRAGR
jgi:iron complex transport system permease protein